MTHTQNSDRSVPVAFMSYADSDDSDGRISTFRARLEEELRAQSGERLPIFQSREDIALGESWRQRLAEGLAGSTFLLPIVTPSFLTSTYCREEVATFLDKERALARNDLVLPVYYIDCEEFLTSTADEAIPATLQALLEHQFSDWRELRLRTPSEPSVRRKRAELAREIRKAMGRFGSAADAPEPPPPESTGAPDRVPVSALLDALFDRDPVTGWPAAREALRRGADIVPAVVERLREMNTPTIFIVRELLAHFPDTAAPLMVERLKTAAHDWHAATFVPNCFSPMLQAHCKDELANLFRDRSTEIDVVRKAIEALGYLGASGWAFAIYEFLKSQADLLSEDLYEKYSGYCIEGLARMTALMPFPAPFVDQLGGSFFFLESAVRLVGGRGWRSITYPHLLEILARGAPHHGDRLLSDWLTADNEDLRDLGAYALGGIGLQRAMPALLARCADPHETDRVRRTAAFAVGVIGGGAAVDGLSALSGEQAPSNISHALTMCVGDAATDKRFAELAERLIESTSTERCWVYRAIGRRGASALLGLVREGLHDTETSIRGDAALALARLSGGSERETLLRARAEASAIRERLLTSLALLSIGEPLADDPGLADLRAMLAAESYVYRSATQVDILECLRASVHPDAAAIVDAWQPIYATSSAY